jgi:hypothetical protein
VSRTRILLYLAAIAALETHASDQNAQLQYLSPPVTLGSPTPEAFWQRFKTEFSDTAEDRFGDRFHSFKVINWNMNTVNERPGQYSEWTTRVARRNFAESAAYGVREAAADIPILLWLEDRQGFLGDFLRNSIGGVEEESVEPLSLSSASAKRSWWSKSAGNDIYCGIRPFRTDPYAFFSMRIRDEETTFLLSHLRYHYRDFADHRFELSLSVPLAHGFTIEVGTSYQFGHRGEERRLALKAFREFKSGGMVLVGLDVRQSPGAFAGISIPL